MGLREDVGIITLTGQLTGHLFVGADHLPEIAVDERESHGAHEFYRPATIPATWELQQAEPDAGILFCAWRTISELQWEIARAQREALADDQQEDLEASASNQAREREIENRIEQMIFEEDGD